MENSKLLTRLPPFEKVYYWTTKDVRKWLIKCQMQDCLEAFKKRNIDGPSLLNLTEEKLISYQELKIKRRIQIANVVSECKIQAANVKGLLSNMVERHSSHKHAREPVPQQFEDDDDVGWDSDFDDDSEGDIEVEEQGGYCLDQTGSGNLKNHQDVTLLSLNRLTEDGQTPAVKQEIHGLKKAETAPSDSTSLTPSLSGTSDSASPVPASVEDFPSLPQPPPLPVTTSSIKSSAIQPPASKAKRPSSQPPPPPVIRGSSSDPGDQETYEPPIAAVSNPEILSSECGVWRRCPSTISSTSSAPSAVSNYEVIEPEEQTYEIVEDQLPEPPPPQLPDSDCPVLPPRSRAGKPPPPLPDKPHRLQAPPPAAKKSFSKLVAPSFLHKGDSKSTRKNSLPLGTAVDGGGGGSLKGSSESLSTGSGNLTRSNSSLSEDIAFRPLPSIPSSPLSLLDQPWFHDVSRVEAESTLRQWGKDGGFLVRPSKLAGPDKPYTLGLLHDGSLFNLSIRRRADSRLALGYHKENELTFGTIEEIIEYHKTKPIILTKKNEVAGKTLLVSTPSKDRPK